MIILFFNEHPLKVAERLLILSSTDSGDAKSITDVILAKLTKAGLISSKVLSKVYDDASVMAGHRGGVQIKFLSLCCICQSCYAAGPR